MYSILSSTVLLCLFVISSIVEANDKRELFEVAGFADIRVGTRTNNDPLQKDSSISELRLQLEAEKEYDTVSVNVAFDFLFDTVLDSYVPDYSSGDGVIDPRQFNFIFLPLENIDIKLGRQILTWGTGDLIFINDLFPKDFKSFFIGRDDEYLKAPSDAIKISVFFSNLNVDLVYVPRFNADRYVDGSRISFFDQSSASFRGNSNPLIVNIPDNWFDDSEFALRFYNSFSGVEAAIYYYTGFWKSPAGIDLSSANALFPELQVLGGSLRSAFMTGIANLEFGYYKSDSAAKNNPLSRNSEFRLLLGYEKDVATELTAGIQYSIEHKLDYDNYLLSLPTNSTRDNQTRNVITLRLTKLMLHQDLKLSFFNFYSPSDEDGYLRLNISYKLSDALKIETGLNKFYGNKSSTFFSQFKNANNLYLATRYDY